MLDRAATQAAGVSGVLFTVAPDGAGNGQVRVGVDYSAFAQAYGGNFGSRLRLHRLPACALTTPTVPQCRQATPLLSSNDPTAKTVSAPLTIAGGAAGSPMVLAASTDPGQEGGAGGTYAATTLKPSGSWTAGGSSGSFDYSYPIAIPPAASRLVPKVELSYTSSAADGQTASTQAQSSWVGEGWATPHSFIEQSFVSCADSPEGSPSPVSTQDMCYDGPVLTMSLGGQSTSLVWDSGTRTCPFAGHQEYDPTARGRDDPAPSPQFVAYSTRALVEARRALPLTRRTLMVAGR